MNDVDAQVMLTLAGLTYRGFRRSSQWATPRRRPRPGRLEGLGALDPWKANLGSRLGPRDEPRSRAPRSIRSAMYVVHDAGLRIGMAAWRVRGTNPAFRVGLASR